MICTSCPTCNQTCNDFEKERCCRLNQAPCYAMAVTRRSPTVRLLSNITTTLTLRIENIMSYSVIPEVASVLQSKNCIKKTRSSLLWSSRDSLLIRSLWTIQSWICLSAQFTLTLHLWWTDARRELYGSFSIILKNALAPMNFFLWICINWPWDRVWRSRRLRDRNT